MENNAYTEVGKIVKALDDTIGNLSIVIEGENSEKNVKNSILF